MKYIDNICSHILEDTVVILGNFDGIHKGHLTLLSKAKEVAKDRGLKTALFTFHPHPTHVLPVKEVSLINTNEEKQLIAAHEGIDYYIQYPFTEDTATMTPLEFINVLTRCIGVKAIVVGVDYRFGKARSGDIALLKEKGEKFGFEVFVLEKLQQNGRDISSTWIREAVSVANISLANQLMGREYMITGTIVEGAKLGRTIGFPTANIKPFIHKQLPQNGVYITQVDLDNRTFFSLTNIGTKPTIDEHKKEILVETYIHNFNEDIYGKTIHVRFHKYLRTEDKFNSLEELVTTMKKDEKAMVRFFQLGKKET